MKKLAYSILAVLTVGFYSAQSQVNITAEIRPRSEFRNGFKTLTNEDNEPAFFTEQRSRLYLDYADTTFKVRLAFQDIRIWGETPQIFKEELGKTFISEAWGQYYFTKKLSVKVGRQIISYDNQRFLGGLEWAQQGRRHDAALLIFEPKDTKLHIGVAYNQDDDLPEFAFLQSPNADLYSVSGNYKNFQYAWFNRKFTDASLSLLAFNAGYHVPDETDTISLDLDPSQVLYRQTFGAVASKTLGNLKLEGDFYYQTGKRARLDRDTGLLIRVADVNAMLGGIRATFKTPVTPITLGYEHISGKDYDDTSADYTDFSPDFGTNHAHNGYMDYFFVGPANGNVGVNDIYLKTAFKVAGGTLKAHVHHFLTGSKQINSESGEELDKSMGTEVDLVFAKKFKGGVVWNLGYSQMFATDTMESLRGGDKDVMQNWAWTMITFKPKLYSSK